jgi:hypothetical protein
MSAFIIRKNSTNLKCIASSDSGVWNEVSLIEVSLIYPLKTLVITQVLIFGDALIYSFFERNLTGYSWRLYIFLIVLTFYN